MNGEDLREQLAASKRRVAEQRIEHETLRVERDRVKAERDQARKDLADLRRLIDESVRTVLAVAGDDNDNPAVRRLREMYAAEEGT